MKNAIILMILAVAIVLGMGCSHEIPNPSEPITINNDIPPTPGNLTVRIGDSLAELSWTIADTAEYTYRIYVAPYNSLATVYSLVGESAGLSYTATDLINGEALFFKVSAVNAAGFEGYKSDSVVAVPNSYSFLINDGDDFTGGRDVTLRISGPVGTALMQFSEDVSFAGAQWESFATIRNFRLSTGDGSKTLFGRFRDSHGKTTAGDISDNITLDTRTGIDSVAFSPSGSPLTPGDIVRFTLYAGEPDGSGSITIGDNIVTIPVYDDGSGGDQVAGDGIYENDYTIALFLDFESQIVYGDFTDRVGNPAPRTAAAQNLSVRRAPDPVAIYSITVPEGYYNRLQLAWNMSAVSDFAQYRIYRGVSAGVDSTDYLVRILTSRSTVTLTDTGLAQNSSYYYRVFVVDNTGLWAGSNEVSGTSGQDDPPAPVTLYSPFATPGYHDRLELNWSSSGENDFLRYELYRSDDLTVDSLDIIVFSSQSQTSYTDTDLESDSLYYYAVITRDINGNTSWSNTVSERTNVDTPPEPVDLFPVVVAPNYYQDIAIDWTESSEDDFHSYRLYRWREDLTRFDSLLVALISESGTTSFNDSPPFDVVGDTVNYWYILHLYDEGGNSTPSDSIRAHLIDSPPGTVSGSVRASVNSLIISWTLSDIPDFGSYVLLRDTDSDPAGAITVYVSADQAIGSFEDITAAQGTTYFYWLDIFDLRDNSSRSAMGSGSW